MNEKFLDFLSTADEDTLREVSEWRYHYPVVSTYWEIAGPGEEADELGLKKPIQVVVCGCEEAFGHTYGQGIHK